ncbi:Putative ribonuclease H protein At1g65750 [Linum perenne]
MCAFWFDYWVKGVSLVSEFPRIAAAAQFLDVSVSNVVSFSDWQRWHIPIRFQLRGGALEEWYSLLRYLASIPRDRFTEGPAFINWSPRSDGQFTVASLRRLLVADKFRGTIDFPFEIIWQPAIPSKIACHLWKVFFNKIATTDNLQRKGFVLVNRCVLCGSDMETVDHLFLNCDFALDVWTRISSILSIHGPHSSSMTGFIQRWKGLNCLTSYSPAMRVILHTFVWFIWKERNDRIFRDVTTSAFRTTVKIWLLAGDWIFAEKRSLAFDLDAWRRLVFDNG